MQSVKDIKSRIKSVSETAQITRAMELISASKMQKASVRYNSSLAYFEKVRPVINEIANNYEFVTPHPYLDPNREGRRAYIVIGSDKGLSGEYNHAITTFASSVIKEDSDILCIGYNVYQYFSHLGDNVKLLYCSPEGKLEDARRIVTQLIEDYKSFKYNEINVIYTSLRSKSKQVCTKIQLLPLVIEEGKKTMQLEFEPDPVTVFSRLVPQYAIGILYGCITAGKYTEHLERMRAMNSATQNANDLLDELQLNYNKARQEKITTELTELSVSLLDE